MIAGERSGSDQGHLTLDDVQQLRKLIETGAAQKSTDKRQNTRIVAQLQVRLPFRPRSRVLRQVTGEKSFGIRIHRAELPYADAPAAFPFASLSIERGRLRTHNLDPSRSQR